LWILYFEVSKFYWNPWVNSHLPNPSKSTNPSEFGSELQNPTKLPLPVMALMMMGATLWIHQVPGGVVTNMPICQPMDFRGGKEEIQHLDNYEIPPI